MLSRLKPLTPDPILGMMAAFREDPRDQKVDLSVGVYQDESGHTPVMRAVTEAEQRILASQTTKTYQGIAGDPEFNQALLELVFGPEHEVLAESKARSIQTPGGCGALRIAAEVVYRANPGAAVWVSRPTWANHIPLIGGAGLRIEEYPYYDSERHEIDFDAMMHALENVGAGDLVLLHACCHNPCGADLSQEQWRVLAELASRKGFLPFIDFAYQGLGDGLDEDAFGVRLMARCVPEMILAVSCSKNFGVYRERIGSAVFIGDSVLAADAIASQAMSAARQIYSMPPAHGAAIVAAILGDSGLRQKWTSELTTVRQRIQSMRLLLSAKLSDGPSGADFGFIADQKGMFSFLGVNAEQLIRLREEYAIYIVGSTRINLAGVNSGNIDYLADSILAVL